MTDLNASHVAVSISGAPVPAHFLMCRFSSPPFRGRILGTAVAGLAPRIMGFGPSPAAKKVLALTGLRIDQMDVIELNEAFAAQALGHPLGASGARLITTALNQLEQTGGRYALCTMCIGVGQGIAMIIERICCICQSTEYPGCLQQSSI